MTYTLSFLAERLDLPWDGPDVTILRPSLVDDAAPGSLTLATRADYVAEAAKRGATALLVPADLPSPLPCLRAEQPRVAFARLLGLFDETPVPRPGIHPTAVIAPDAVIHPEACIGPLAVVEERARVGARSVVSARAFIGWDAIIGDDVFLAPGASVLHRCRVGDRVRVQSGAVIGSEGFGYEWDGERHVRVPHLGAVVLEDEVEVGANATIDRGKTGETVIGRGTKMDNLVQVGHGTHIGPHCLLAGQAGVSGSVTLGAGVVLAGQAGVADNVTVGPRAIVAAQAGVTRDLPGGRTYMGMPAREAGDARRSIIGHDQLPDILRRLRALEKKAG